MKIIFFGSDEFAATNLEKLIREGHEIVGVVTPPDRARDRMRVTFLPVKMIGLEHLFPIFQPEDLSDQSFQKTLQGLEADLFVVIAYGQFLPQEILGIPKHCCINVHASLLPKYRGAAPINWAIINGENRTGVTVIEMNERMDAGLMLGQKAMDIPEDMDARVLRERLADLGSECLVEVIKSIEDQTTNPIPQDEASVTFAKKLTRELGHIDWNKPAWENHNLVRGLVPWPGAYTYFEGKRLKVLETSLFSEKNSSSQPATVLALICEGIVVACGHGQLLLKRVHPESAKPMDARSFSVGHKVVEGAVFHHEK